MQERALTSNDTYGPYDGHAAADRDDDNRDITAFSHVDDDADNTVLVVDLPLHVDHGC